MSIETCHATVKENSTKVSEIIRQIGFAGIAIIWIFRINTGNPENAFDNKISPELILPAILIMLTLILDFLQYTVNTVIWSIYAWIKEQQGMKPNKTFPFPPCINNTAWAIFGLKVITIMWAYFLILKFLFTKLI